MAAVRSQTSFEFIAILSIVLIVLVVLVSMNNQVFNMHDTRVTRLMAEDTVNEIHKAAENVYREGDGAKTKIFLKLPGGISSTFIGDGRIRLNISTRTGGYDVVRKVPFNITGSVLPEDGYYWINVTSEDGEVVVNG
ncbi:MAG: hypothetical protein ACQEP1_06480 [Nanobdellota archaeon]